MTSGIPLRFSRDRIWLYGIALILFEAVYQLTVITVARLQYGIDYFHQNGYIEDWANFWAAGATAGTRMLLDPKLHWAWQAAHHFRPQVFIYTPGFAWFLAPFTFFSPEVSLILNACIMAAALFYAGVVAARVYQFDVRFALLAIFAWYPAQYALAVNQNSPLALLLLLIAISGLVKQRPLVAGLAIGALLYKPIYALPFILLLLVRRDWRTLGIVSLCAGIWYVLSATATGGDWGWPATYLHMIQGYYHGDIAWNAHKVFSLPTILMANGLSMSIAYGCGVLLLLLGAPLLARVPMLEAASMAGLLALATSPHSWPYDGTLILPSVFFAMASLREPWRTNIAVAAYLIALFMMFIGNLSFNPLVILVLGGTASWYILRYTKRLPPNESTA